MRFRVTRSGNAFSPWEISKSIASCIKDFAFDSLLMQAIRDEGLNDGEGTEDDPSEGTGFEAVQHPVKSLSSVASPPTPSAASTPSPPTRIPLQPSPGPSHAGMAHSSDPSNSVVSFVEDVDSHPVTIPKTFECNLIIELMSAASIFNLHSRTLP